MTEIPLAASGSWQTEAQEAIRVGLAAADTPRTRRSLSGAERVRALSGSWVVHAGRADAARCRLSFLPALAMICGCIAFEPQPSVG